MPLSMSGYLAETLDPFMPYEQILDSGHIGYAAGFPHYPRNFSRDTIISGILASDPRLLVSQLAISALRQGVEQNPITGEMPGKIHHEFPGVTLNGGDKHTTYNACDTTALFVIAAEGLMRLKESSFNTFTEQNPNSIKSAVGYILSHVEPDGLFWERPPEGSDNFALKVTYWKDSILPHADGKSEPVYPVVFSLAHFIAARALKSASFILGDESLSIISGNMFRTGIEEFVRPDGFTVYRDKIARLDQVSSDELNALAYIPDMYRDLLPLGAIQERAKLLETPFGYMCTPLDIALRLADRYHGDSVWVADMAMIHYGATKLQLHEQAVVASSVAIHIGEGQELFSVLQEESGAITPIPSGCTQQLWSTAAREYFAGRSDLSTSFWL